jgi:lysophospholipase
MKEIFAQSFNTVTQGNGTLDRERPECLAYAVIEKSLEKVRMGWTAQCARCFGRYCWDRTMDIEVPEILDPILGLDSGLSFV